MTNDPQPRDREHDPDDPDKAKEPEAGEAAPAPAAPFDPKADDDTAAGDTDEHSDA